jgi:hypothetical protein
MPIGIKRKLTKFLSDPKDPKAKDAESEAAASTAAGTDKLSDITGGEPSNYDEADFDVPLGQVEVESSSDTSSTLEAVAEAVDDVQQEGSTETNLTKSKLEALEVELKAQHLAQIAAEKSAEPSQPILNKNENRRFEALKLCETKGFMDPHSYAAQLFRDAHKKNTKAGDEFAACKTRDAQTEFKNNWNHIQLKGFRESKIHKKAWRRVDTDRGDYMNLDQLLMNQGTSDDAQVGTARLMAQCVAMGQPWTRIHPQTQRILYLVLSFKFQEDFEQSWSHYTEETSSGPLIVDPKDPTWHAAKMVEGGSGAGEIIAAQPSGTVTAGLDGKNNDGKKGKGEGVGGKGGKGKGKTKGVKDTKGKTKSKFDALWANAAKFKIHFAKTTADAMDLLEQIDLSPAWLFARNPQHKGELAVMLETLKAKLTAFQREFLVEDVKKTAYGEDFITKELDDLLGFKTDVDSVSKYIATLKKRRNS